MEEHDMIEIDLDKVYTIPDIIGLFKIMIIGFGGKLDSPFRVSKNILETLNLLHLEKDQ